MRWAGIVAAAVGATLVAGPLRAEPVRAHAALGGAHAVGAPQGTEFGFGAMGLASVEVPIGRSLGIEPQLGGLILAPGEPRGANLAEKGAGTAFTAMGGARLRFLGRPVGGPWASVHAGLVVTGDAPRFGFDASLGWDFRVGAGRVDVGPFVSYVHVLEPDGGLAPEDAHVLVLGISVGLGAPILPPLDTDADGIADTEDACPTEPGIRTTDPKTNGCPRRDADHDGVFDDEDACVHEPGIRTSDPATNGCPRRDKDGDGVFDDEDACVDVPGIRTTDPKTNGCPPPDRDHDGVIDADDACPDLAGVKTTDPKTNGCPPAQGGARVEGDSIVLDDVILFDVDSPRVRHVSWPIVKKLAELLLANPDIIEVFVEGHADRTGTPEHNQQLSKDRAEAVKQLLVYFKVDANRITTHAYGNTKPRAAGSGEDALRQNRRVEFTITRTKTSPGGRP